MNVSNIISSLVEANKNKLINKPIQPLTTIAGRRDEIMFNKEDFKLFPNKKNSSIYEPSSASKVSSTSRSKYDDKSFEFQNDKNRSSLSSSENVKRVINNNLVVSSQQQQPQQSSRGSISSMM